MFRLFLDAALLVVINSVNAIVSTVVSIGASISEFFIASPVTVSHPPSAPPPSPPPPPPPSVVEIVYLYGKWVPPYLEILHADPDFTVFEFDIRINEHDFYASNWCFRCRHTVPGCKNCQRKPKNYRSWEEVTRLYETAEQDAKLEIDNMMNNVQKFRDACKMFKKAALENLSYLHFLRMVQNSQKMKDHRYLHLRSFNFSDFDGFFRKCMNVYPVSQQLKDTGMQCQIYSDEALIRFVQFPNSRARERIYPEFENVSTRNELLALSMSMRILSLLVSTNYMSQSRRNREMLGSLIARKVISMKCASILILIEHK